MRYKCFDEKMKYKCFDEKDYIVMMDIKLSLETLEKAIKNEEDIPIRNLAHVSYLMSILRNEKNIEEVQKMLKDYDVYK